MIVYCTPDLIFASRIGSTAQTFGLPAVGVRTLEDLQRRFVNSPEPITAVIVDLDLADEAHRIIRHVREVAPHLRIVAYGPHVLTDDLDAARQEGAHDVMTRGAFSARLPNLLPQLASPAREPQ